jgi:hypothetical protein
MKQGRQSSLPRIKYYMFQHSNLSVIIGKSNRTEPYYLTSSEPATHLDPYCEAEKMDYDLHNGRSSKDKCCKLDGKKLIDFCERQAFHILNGKYGSNMVGDFTFINQLGRSVMDYTLVSEGLIGNLIDFRIGTELISSHMLLSVVLGNMLEDSVVMEPKKNIRVSRIVNYKWKENLKVEFVENLKSNEIQLCMGSNRICFT